MKHLAADGPRRLPLLRVHEHAMDDDQLRCILDRAACFQRSQRLKGLDVRHAELPWVQHSGPMRQCYA
eukprot:691323-Alexandrium_andersonii.AAC.1